MAKRTKQTCSRCGADQSSILLLSEIGPSGTSTLVCSPDVNLHDQIPVLILYVLEANVTEDAGVVDENVNAAEVLDGGFDDCLAILNAVVVGHSLSAGFSDLIDDYIGGLLVSSVSSVSGRMEAGWCERVVALPLMTCLHP